jgi:formylmethanofuran dehydrogenase subunit E
MNGKRLCTPCKRYAKLNNGAMRLIPRPKTVDCDRCNNQVTKTFCLSNRARVCIDCHNEIFADYDPDNDPYASAEAERIEDWGEKFFDHCLLIYSHELLRSVQVGKRSANNQPNVRGLPCKVCHATTAANWRPALDSAMICEPCYNHVRKLIEEYDLHTQLSEDGTNQIKGMKTLGFECAKCANPIVGAKWRAGAPGGRNIVCTPCFNESHGI